ncbi:UvrD-helicase domain-containing protein [Paraburkholderia acidisoli]|uniref:DNA 3'-5' helicase II n=1 Tax=Paraburkholderia acidisoli TaxID=2571748 RepID=A0A7Z2GSS5_9BURK|nr:UvrD-helicase domain-containing protein [Paraburkholderia acidisoli]QGZ66949.1 hypothetical protein FAZ98_34475 [Paraburkholderia acidisoli]
MRRFILVDGAAADDLVSTRTLQSDDFEHGQTLGEVLKGTSAIKQLTTRTYLVEDEQGLYFLQDASKDENVLIIDLETAPVFTDGSTRDSIIRFQKLLRFARRRWAKVGPAQNEKLFNGSSKAVVFPYPITTQSSIRMSVEMAPDRHRREKRTKGIELLVYRIGTDEGGGLQEEASVTNFRKAIEGLAAAKEVLRARVRAEGSNPAASSVDSLSVTRLTEGTVRGAIAGCDFDQWDDYLTDSQKAFVNQELSSPHRIEGPAGTGKTLSLVLKCIFQMRAAKERGEAHSALFVSHSEATRRSIESMFDPEKEKEQVSSSGFALQSVKVTTLHELCGELLRYEISDTELLDRDAFESKQSQLLYAVEALQEVIKADLLSHRAHMSASFCDYLTSNDEWVVAEMLQHEISVMIKGRADEDLEKYKRLPKLRYGLPVVSEGDKAFTFLLFSAYQRRLRASGQFDTDDVVLSALQQLDTPIWRRRREKEGYDSIFVDETHLFNINELSIFHRLTRTADRFPIAYSADISQSLADKGWADNQLSDALLGSASRDDNEKETTFSSIFRCSPEIVNLAFSVTSSGATLFTNFHDPLAAASSAFTEAEERKCQPPKYVMYPTDEAMIAGAFEVADVLASEMQSTRGDIALIVFGSELFAEVERQARGANKPVELLKHRGDMAVVRQARSSGRFVISTPDYVGGLEFDAVILIGVDKGRVPPKVSAESADSENFVSYATHQRLYVAITRARYRIALLGVKARGMSDVLGNAAKHGLLQLEG